MPVQRVVTIHYHLTDPSGKTIDSSEGRGPFSYLEGAGQIIPGLERALSLLSAGQETTVQVAAAEAYGVRRPELVLDVPKTKLPQADVKIGDRFRGGPDEHAPVFTVIEVGADTVKLDGNHPLAGVDLTFRVNIVSMREASSQEIEHGHSHDGGHDH
ncbi:MAG: FKBP-type peptidyl-prolyl cis-trans isomerase SlyD [Candidatus Omnitrophica bacterium]|nr:FKBP-type peptidyl-prolyl cis-trans isomerase SlyD [Candidatus Omnitrophota bacterium]